jgi:hypothetical protein
MLDRNLRNLLVSLLNGRFEDAAKYSDYLANELAYGVKAERFEVEAAITDAKVLTNTQSWIDMFPGNQATQVKCE